MYAVAGEGVKEYGECGDKGLTLASGHLGNLALVEHGTTEELDIIVHHVPQHVVAAGYPVVGVDGLVVLDAHKVLGRGKLTVEVGGGHHHLLVLREATGGLLHDAESHGEHLVKSLLVYLQYFLLYLVHLVEDGLALVDRCFLYLRLELFHFRPLFLGGVLNVFPDFHRAGAQLVMAERLYLRIDGFNTLHNRLYQLHVTSGLVAEERLQNL